MDDSVRNTQSRHQNLIDQHCFEEVIPFGHHKSFYTLQLGNWTLGASSTSDETKDYTSIATRYTYGPSAAFTYRLIRPKLSLFDCGRYFDLI